MTTPNFGLSKPAGADDVDIDVINGNMDLIDAAAAKVAEAGDFPEPIGSSNTVGTSEFAAHADHIHRLSTGDRALLDSVTDKFDSANILRASLASNFSATNTTTHANVPGMALAVGANQVWLFYHMFMVAPGDVAADANFRFTLPTGATFPGVNASYTTGTMLAISASVATPSSGFGVLGFLLLTSGTAGNVQMQFAQNVASATPTVLQAGASMMAIRMA